MDYDFSGLCVDQLEKIKKRLESLNKDCIKEYKMALNVINNPVANEHRGEIMIGVDDLLRDVVGKCEIFYTETMNKVQRELVKHLQGQ
jgi:hypothetical protein